MKAVVKVRPEPGVEVREVDVPRFEADEVLLKVRAAAICGSDLGIYDFTPAYSGMELPVVLGHEFAGRVAEVGSDVEGFEVGDEVLGQSVLACGECGFCRGGLDNLCEDRGSSASTETEVSRSTSPCPTGSSTGYPRECPSRRPPS